MDRNTLSRYGWIVVIALVFAVMLAFATPFGKFAGKTFLAITDGYIDAGTGAVSEENLQKHEDMWNEEIFLLKDGTNYTIEEIEADSHLYAIGQTKPEYVVARFNDDYTEVVITQNTVESDGIMMDWEAWFDFSPMQQHQNTLTKAIIKEGIVNIGQSSGGRGAFARCTNLVDISFPTSLTKIGQSAFDHCGNLKNVKLPKNLQTLRNLSFNACASLTQITIPTGVDKIERGTFQNCTSLKTVNLHKGIIAIDTFVFYNISDNAIIYCETQEVANLLEKDVNYNGTTQIIVDASKF